MRINIENGKAKIGMTTVGSYSIDGMNSKGSEDIYNCYCLLPGIERHLGRYKTEEECKKKLLKCINLFIKSINS